MTVSDDPIDTQSAEQSQQASGDSFTIDRIEGGAVAFGRGATAVYQGLSYDEVLALFNELKNENQPAVWDGRIPYLGLKAFQEADAQFFFGREALVDDLLRRVAEDKRFIVIAGPSGSGKSSVARAGLLHALRLGRVEGSEKWVLAAMSPREKPLEYLALALGRDGGDREAEKALLAEGLTSPLALHDQVQRLRTMSDDPRRRFVLLVDQFEELFTQTKEEEARTAFIPLLTSAATAADGRTIILISLRSEFVSNCALYPELREQINQENQFQLVGAMAPRDLAQAITLPALEVGAAIDPALVKQIIDDMKGEPGALPLMSFALRDLFLVEKTKPGQVMDLTLAEYVDRGGIDQALERHADEVFRSFTDEERALARSIFSKLVTVGEGRLDTRRTAAFEELKPADTETAAVAAVVGALAAEDVRLVTTSGIVAGEALSAEEIAAAQTTVTLAHEKLIDAWPWLRRLIDENRELIALQNQINRDTREWAIEEDDGFLYTGGRLVNVEEQWDAIRPHLDVLSHRFIEASFAERQRREAEEEANRQREEDLRSQRRIGQILRWATIIVGLLLLLAVALGALAYWNSRQLAELKNRIQASQLALESEAVQELDQELALLLATAGMGISPQRDTLARFYSASFRPFRGSLAGHKGSVYSASFSPDGERIVTAGDDGSVKVWDLAGNELASLLGHTAAVQSASFSPDGQRIVTAGADGSARVWDLAGNELTSLVGHTDAVSLAGFSPDGQRIVTAGADGGAKVWDLAGNELASLLGHDGPVSFAGFSPDGQRIIAASYDGSAKVWDLAGNELTSLVGHDAPVRSASFSPDGQQIITAGYDGSARVWDLAGNELASLVGHATWVSSASFSPDGQHIVTASADGSAKVWDLAGNELASLVGHTDAVLQASFSPSGQHIMTASADGSAKVWSLAGNELASLVGHDGPVWSASFSPDGQRIVTAGADGSAKVWDVPGNELASLVGHYGPVNSASFNPDGQRIVTASYDGSARIWDLAGNELATFVGHGDRVRSAGFSPDGQRIVTAGDDGSAKVWDIEGNELASLVGHTAAVQSASFSPDGQRIVTAGDDGSAKVWDIEGNELASLVGHTAAVQSASFSPDGQRIVTASFDHSAKMWDLAGNELASFVGHVDRVRSARFSPDGLRIVTAGDNRSVKVWHLAGTELASLEGHTALVWSADFSPDGQHIVTASEDHSVKLWDLAGNELASLEGHTDGVRSASFSPDGQRIVTASADVSAKLWEIYPSLADKLAVARERLSRGFSEDECRRFFRDDPDSCPRTLDELFALFEDDLESP
ncbi:MAG: hypothetical protein R3293_18385 [Candidatus Promineifilaceae bacterium]|nr:hypothetical protein [Candidatus Promineifilaceae bacterium]